MTAYRSVDGTNWTDMGCVTTSMGGTFYAGLAVAARDNNDLCTVEFDNVSGDWAPATRTDHDDDRVPDWADPDDDNDGMSDDHEGVAGTDPFDEQSYFSIEAFLDLLGPAIRFYGITNRLYTVEYKDVLTGTNDWAVLTNGVLGANEMLKVPSPGQTAQRFFRVVVTNSP